MELIHLLAPISGHTIGVYASDLVPKVWQKPVAFIVNTDDSKRPGSHWLAIYVNKKGEGFCFDSLAFKPNIANIADVLRRNCKTVKFNDRQVQSDFSNVCSQMSLMFLYYMTHEIGAESFFELFSKKNLLANDKIAREFVEALNQQNMKKKKNCAIFAGDGYKNSLFPPVWLSSEQVYIMAGDMDDFQSEFLRQSWKLKL